jgi:hypothetical protein
VLQCNPLQATLLEMFPHLRYWSNLVPRFSNMIKINIIFLISFLIKMIFCLRRMTSLRCSKFFTLVIYFPQQNLTKFPEVPIHWICFKHKVTQWCPKFSQVNLQGNFNICAFQKAWQIWSACDVHHVVCWSVIRLSLWSLFVFETSCCFKVYTKSW